MIIIIKRIAAANVEVFSNSKLYGGFEGDTEKLELESFGCESEWQLFSQPK